jgi:ATPase subunit of ABC transporter with duplicated ATPase domains
LVKSQTSLKADARELFSEKQLTFIEPFLEKIKLTEEESELINQSYEAVAKQKAAEKSQQEAENQRLQERQQLLEKTQHSQKRFIRWISVALIIVIGLAIWAYNQKQKATKAAEETADALDNNKRQQAIAKARELEAFGDSYKSLGKFDFAITSYRAGLDSLAGLGSLRDSQTDRVSGELNKKIESCK